MVKEGTKPGQIIDTGETINADAIQQEIEQEKQLNRLDDGNGEINPYRELIVNNVERTEPPMTQSSGQY